MKKGIGFLFLLCAIGTFAYGQTYKNPDATVEARINDLLARMSLDEKIGQMTQANLTEMEEGDVTNYYLGSVLSGGGSYPPGGNSLNNWIEMYDRLQQAALGTRLGIPLIYGIDAVHGNNAIPGAVIFPHNIGLGAANDPELMERIGSITALEVAATGLDWTFAPCLAVARDIRWGRTYESFSETPEIHANLTGALIRGLQGADASMGGQKIVACAKHWIADGGTEWGTGFGGLINAGDVRVTEAELRALHLPPYLDALESGAGTFMSSFSSWNGTRCTGSQFLLTTLLKNELGFDGFVVSDWNSIRDLEGSYRTQIKTAINAGIDMAMAPGSDDWKDFLSHLKNLVNAGEVSESRIDDAVRRILRVKFRAGLFENPFTDRSLSNSFGSTAHREVAREAVRKSAVLLKNDGLLPLGKDISLMVTGSAATSLVKQCGGWSIGWQGMGYDGATTGTTVRDGIRERHQGPFFYNATGSGAGQYDAAVVVIGEESYAESDGDKADLRLDSQDRALINTLADSGTPFVVVLFSGRPMIITSELEKANAWVAAFLPGTEGGDGLAELLYGEYDFSGKLSFSWPRDMNQVPINTGDNGYDPLFPYGYGLSYNNKPGNKKGDANGDGKITIVDALVTAQYSVAQSIEIDITAADTNCNGNISIIDALIIAQYSVGLITQFPGCK